MSIGDAEQLREPVAERTRGARARRERDVVRHRRPEARRRDALVAAGVLEHADDPGRPFVARVLEAEALDELRVARRAGHRRRARVRHVGEQRAERDDELDVEIAREVEHELREGLPAQARLDAEQQHDVAVGARDPSVVEGVLRPLDLPRHPLVERDVRPVRLEVDEALRIDVREPLGVPDAREVARGERRTLAAVVPAPEGCDQDGSLERGTPHHPQLAHGAQSTRGPPEGGDEPDRPGPDRGGQPDVDQDEPPRQLVPPLQLADAPSARAAARAAPPRPDRAPPHASRLRTSQSSRSRKEIPNAAVARTWR